MTRGWVYPDDPDRAAKRPKLDEIPEALDVPPCPEMEFLLSFVYQDDERAWFNDGKILVGLKSKDLAGMVVEIWEILNGNLAGYEPLDLEKAYGGSDVE
jgi:hypothetical protein